MSQGPQPIPADPSAQIPPATPAAADAAAGRVGLRLSEAQQDIAERYRPFALSLARPYIRMWPDLADAFGSAAFLGLTQAAGKFDPARGVKFPTFARNRIIGVIRDELRLLYALGYRTKASRAAGDVPKTVPIDGKRFRDINDVVAYEFDDWEIADPRPGPESDVERAETFTQLCRLLPGRHAELARLIYAEGKTQRAAAAAMRISDSRVSYLHAEALTILRDAVVNDPGRFGVEAEELSHLLKGRKIDADPTAEAEPGR